MRVLNGTQVREADRRTVAGGHASFLELMERAGGAVAAEIAAAFAPLAGKTVAVICGPGNNGGDGCVVARVLQTQGAATRLYLLGDLKHEAGAMLTAAREAGVPVVRISEPDTWQSSRSDVCGADVIVDAIFGTGLHRPLDGHVAAIVGDVNGSGRPVVAVDLPSGLSADRSEPIGPAIRAALTVTFAAPKLPLVSPPADAFAGRVVVADIGIPGHVVEGLDGPRVELLTMEAVRKLMSPRAPDSHKGTYGHVLIVAGSPGKSGAAGLAGMAALRAGAGLVTVATPERCADIVAGFGMEFMTVALPQTADGLVAPLAVERVVDVAADVIAVGPGLGRSAAVREFVRGVIARSEVSLVIDADALDVFAASPHALQRRSNTKIVVTPHPGEMGRLLGVPTATVQAARLDVATSFASANDVHVVLKGHRTVIASPDGRAAINLTGNPGMATGGTGDVLAGVAAAWLGQVRDAHLAACAGTFLHGLAGDLAAEREGQSALIAGDVIRHLGAAMKRIGEQATPGGTW